MVASLRISTHPHLDQVAHRSRTPSIAVIIINFNSGPFLARAIESVANQSVRPSKVIVIDNASTDNSLALVPWDIYPNVRLERLSTNLGFAAASNIAAQRVDSEWLAMLNCDAIADPNWLLAMVDAQRRNPSVAMFTSKQTLIDHPDRLDGAGDVLSVTGLAWRGGYGAYSTTAPAEGRCFGACAAGAFIARDLFHELGGFEESFFCYLEDLDFAYRARLAGEDCVYVPDARIQHKGAASSAACRNWPLRISARNRMLLHLRNTPLLLAILTWPLILLGALIGIAQGTRHGATGAVILGYLDALKALPTALAQRRRLAPPYWPPWSLLTAIAWNPFAVVFRAPRVQPIRTQSSRTPPRPILTLRR